MSSGMYPNRYTYSLSPPWWGLREAGNPRSSGSWPGFGIIKRGISAWRKGISGKIQPESLLAQISMVMQNAYLFRGSIRENLCFGNETISEERMIEACRKACCHEFISSLPEGYDTMVGEGGATLSGGESQRISLARAFLKDVPILLLDEPTASLDADNEAMVQRALDEIAKERTVVMIAHRLKTVRAQSRFSSWRTEKS